MEKKLKVFVQHIMISIFGFSRYLYLIAVYRMKTFAINKRQTDFKYFVTLIPDEGHILDIGANIGYTTWYLAKNKPHAVIHAFEPIPYNFEVLKKVVADFKLSNAVVYPVGLGEQDATLEMIMPVINGVKKHARCQVLDDNSKYKDGVRFTIKIEKLDDYSIFYGKENKVTAIKIDVEDYEYFVFKGGLNLIRNHQPIIFCEIWTSSERKFKVVNLFKSLNYKIKIYSNSSLVDFDSSVHLSGNLILLPPDTQNTKATIYETDKMVAVP